MVAGIGCFHKGNDDGNNLDTIEDNLERSLKEESTLEKLDRSKGLGEVRHKFDRFN